MPDGSLSPELLRDRHGIGGNMPPEPIELLRATLADLTGADRARVVSAAHQILLDAATQDDPERAATRARLEAACAKWDKERPEILDDDQLAKAGNVVRLLTDAVNAEEKARTGAKRPYIDGGRAIDGAFKVRLAPIEGGKARMTARISRYQAKVAAERRAAAAEAHRQAEAAAQAARDLERQQREVQAAAAQGAPVDAAQLAADAAAAEDLRRRQAEAQQQAAALATKPEVRSDHGVLVTSKVVKRLQVDDESLIPDEFWEVNWHKVRLALDTGREIPGARLVDEPIPLVR
jgi:hypothetical protein